jgi:hypothetical protein
MIDPAHPAISLFLWLMTAGFLVVFALPLFLAPLAWARVFRWRVPEDTDLVVYFGRCVGGLALALAVGWIQAAMAPAAHRIVFEINIAGGGAMTIVHVWGAVLRRQPWTEDAEILMYGGLTIAHVFMLRAL